MKYSFNQLICISLFILMITGCSKGGSNPPVVIPDTTKPSISITYPTPGQAFVAGNTIPFQAAFSDNEALKNYDIAISKKVTGAFSLKVVPTSVPFSYTKSATSLSGKTQSVTVSDILIPANTATTIVTTGVYNFKVNCTDSSNNSYSTTIEININ